MTTYRANVRGEVPEAAGLQAGLTDLVSGFSLGLDAAEGREAGHAVRVAYVATLLAHALGLDEADRRAVLYAGLLHDVGVPAAAATLAIVPRLDEESLFAFAPLTGDRPPEVPPDLRDIGVGALRAHVTAGAAFLAQPWFPEATAAAIRAHHENWDGSGYPAALAGEASPITARILRAADLFECVVAGESNPLSARAQARQVVHTWVGRELQPEMADALGDLARDDGFWLGYYDAEILSALVNAAPPDGVRPSRTLFWAFSEAVARMVDFKAGYEPGRALRVAECARSLGTALGMSASHVDLLAAAALWNDVGTLAVPSRILVKPDILSLDEMQRMRAHAAFSGEVVGEIPALAHAAPWVANHHERPDARGYPEMLRSPEIGTEASILSVCDAFVALTSPRPYRKARSVDEAFAVLEAGAGAQWDAFIVRAFIASMGGQQAASA